ncbi:concanavalin A-like lectin/glucanase, partial [Tothia fuscella]
TTAICECGFSTNETHNTVFTDYLEQDFTNGKVDGWIPQEYNVSQQDARGPYGKQAHPENVVPTSQGLELWVRPSHIENKTIPMAEVASKRTDMLFGSFRIRARMSGVNGTCGAFFWFWNNTQEIDMEFLSRQFSQSNTAPVNLVIQSPASELAGFDASKTPGFDNHLLPFRPDLDFHEYRFDWIPGKVSFYADNVWLKDMTVDIPDTAGHVVLNHWSNGDKYWSGGPPEQDASMLVTHAAMYFNSSDKNMLALHKKQCKKRDSSKICVIPT